MLVRCCGS